MDTMEMELPEGWRRTTLGEVVTLQRGKDLSKELRQPGPYPVIGSSGVVGTHAEYVAEGPGVLVGRSGSVGTVSWIDGRYWPLNTSLWVTSFHGNDAGFAYHLLNHLKLSRYAEGASVPTLNRNLVHPIKIAVPPLSEQRAIATVLGAVQAALAARRRELQLEQEHKAALLEHLFTRGTRGEATRETELGALPVSWAVTTLGNLLNIKGGKRLAKGAPFAETQTPHPYLRVTDFTNGTIRIETLKYITAEVQAPIARYIIRKADVYISIAGSIGLVGVVPDELDGANLTENAARLVIKDPTQLDRDYLAKYLATEHGQQQIQSLTVKTTQPKLALARIAWIKIPLPPLPEQQRIAAVLGALDTKLVALATEVARLEELFRALLEELLSGRLRAGTIQ